MIQNYDVMSASLLVATSNVAYELVYRIFSYILMKKEAIFDRWSHTHTRSSRLAPFVWDSF
jgi:hypothetical protein